MWPPFFLNFSSLPKYPEFPPRLFLRQPPELLSAIPGECGKRRDLPAEHLLA